MLLHGSSSGCTKTGRADFHVCAALKLCFFVSNYYCISMIFLLIYFYNWVFRSFYFSFFTLYFVKLFILFLF